MNRKLFYLLLSIFSLKVSKSTDINGRLEETRSGEHLNELEYDEWMKEHCGRSSFVAGLKKKFQSGSSRTLPSSLMPGESPRFI